MAELRGAATGFGPVAMARRPLPFASPQQGPVLERPEERPAPLLSICTSACGPLTAPPSLFPPSPPEVIPKPLSVDAAKDATELVAKLRAYHYTAQVGGYCSMQMGTAHPGEHCTAQMGTAPCTW